MIKAELESRDHTEESLLFAKVAQICRREQFNEGFEFKGNLDARKVLTPTVNWLISLIMYGEKLDGLRSDTQKCNTISQLLIFNSKKKQKSVSLTAKERRIIEMSIPLYIGMKMHTTTRSKTLIEKFAKLGSSLSYDRVLQVYFNKINAGSLKTMVWCVHLLFGK